MGSYVMHLVVRTLIIEERNVHAAIINECKFRHFVGLLGLVIHDVLVVPHFDIYRFRGVHFGSIYGFSDNAGRIRRLDRLLSLDRLAEALGHHFAGFTTEGAQEFDFGIGFLGRCFGKAHGDAHANAG